MSGFRPKDSKREEYRKYLERAGVMDALTKVLVMLYEEADKPDDALEYVRSNLGDRRPTYGEMESLKYELQTALDKVSKLEEENAELKKRIAELSPPDSQDLQNQPTDNTYADSQTDNA